VREFQNAALHTTGDLTVDLAHKDFEVPFDIFLLACLDRRQDSRVPNENLFS